jgi:hypothetical protein
VILCKVLRLKLNKALVKKKKGKKRKEERERWVG